jgi:predicted nuclease of predicted toxin-antitoxin system
MRISRAELAEMLRAAGHDVQDVPAGGLAGHPDDEVWALAQSAGRLLITQDIRFGDVRMFTQGEHAGFVLVRLKRYGRRALIAKLQYVFASHDVESWAGCLVVVGESKVRVRRGR